jgi:hypothetical protein
MGLAVWLFLRRADGIFQSFPTARYARFHDGREHVPTLAGQEARFAEVVVELAQRRATRVCRVTWPKHRLDAAGRWDAQSRQAGVRDALESLCAPSGEDVLQGREEIAIEPLLAEIRYSTRHLWDPTEDDLTHFCAAVNQRAKRPLVTHDGTDLIPL